MGVLFTSKAAIDPDYMRKKRKAERKAGKEMAPAEYNAIHQLGGEQIERYWNKHL